MTRLFYEKMLLDSFPLLRWVRVYTTAPHTVTVYACDANLDLSDDMAEKLNIFLSEMGLASCIHIVKHYFELQKDEAFPIGQIPDCLREAALEGKVSRSGICSAIKKVFPPIDPERFEVENAEVTFHLRKAENWTPYQKAFAELMLSEILPVGSTARLAINDRSIVS